MKLSPPPDGYILGVPPRSGCYFTVTPNGRGEWGGDRPCYWTVTPDMAWSRSERKLAVQVPAAYPGEDGWTSEPLPLDWDRVAHRPIVVRNAPPPVSVGDTMMDRLLYELEVSSIAPSWSDRVPPVPACADTCPKNDGKRCELLGRRPSLLCEPAVRMAMGMLLARAEPDPEGPDGPAPMAPAEVGQDAP